jgi:hypothetical protein
MVGWCILVPSENSCKKLSNWNKACLLEAPTFPVKDLEHQVKSKGSMVSEHGIGDKEDGGSNGGDGK